MPPSGNRDGYRPVKSSERTLEILEVLAASSDRRTLGELARMLDVPKSSLHAILRTMEARGWIESGAPGLRFGLGLRALHVGTAYVDSDDIVNLAQKALDWLVGELDETVHLGRLDGTDIVYLAKRESSQQLRMFSAIGRRLPAYTTALGKALLAELSEERLHEHLPDTLTALTPRTLTTIDALKRDLARTRKRGYAIDNQENSEGVACVAVALPATQPPVDAISCSVPVTRLGNQRRAEITEQMLVARDRITLHLRHTAAQ